MADKLKPCPFCGSENITMGAFSFSQDCNIICENCGACIETEVPWNDMNKKEHDAECFKILQKAWNTRIKDTI